MPNNSEGLVIFDVGGVLVDSTEAMFDCYHYSIRSSGASIEWQQAKPIIKAEWGARHQDIFNDVIPDREVAVRACEFYEHCLNNSYTERIREAPGTPEALGDLAVTHALAIATAEPPTVLRRKIMPMFGIDPSLFEQIESAYDYDSSKDKRTPFILNKIMNTIGFEPDQTAVVGDAPCDVRMAKAVGAKSIAVESPIFREEDFGNQQPDYYIPDLSHLRAALGKVGLRPAFSH